MSLETVYYVGQTVAVVTIIVSLVFVGLQIRQNTRAQLLSSDMASNDGNREIMLELFKDAELTKLMMAGLSGELQDPIDRFRFSQWARHVTESHMTFFIQHERGTATGEVFDYWSKTVDRLCQQPGYVAEYKIVRDLLKPSYRDYMDAKMDIGTSIPGD
jgi:hypothetical protein